MLDVENHIRWHEICNMHGLQKRTMKSAYIVSQCSACERNHAFYSLIYKKKVCSYTSPPNRHVHSDTNFSREHSVMLKVLDDDYSLTFPPLSIATYSFIQLNELGRRGETKMCKLRNGSNVDSNPNSQLGVHRYTAELTLSTHDVI